MGNASITGVPAVARVFVAVVLVCMPLAVSALIMAAPNSAPRPDNTAPSDKQGKQDNLAATREHAAAPNDNASWLQELDQSPLTPPPYVFGVVWTALYLLMGVAVALLVDRAFEWTIQSNTANQTGQTRQQKKSSTPSWGFFAFALIFFAAQLAANYAYLHVFFKKRDVEKGLHVLVALLALFACTCAAFAPVSPLGAALLCPCGAYLVFAAMLHTYLRTHNTNHHLDVADTLDALAQSAHSAHSAHSAQSAQSESTTGVAADGPVSAAVVDTVDMTVRVSLPSRT